MTSLFMRRIGRGQSIVELPPVVPDVTMNIRPTERMFVDLSTALSGIDDTNRVTLSVTNTSGALSACVWLGKTLPFVHDVSGATVTSATMTKNWLLDNFWVETAGATDGATAGAITVSGYSGANGTGSLVSTTIALACVDAPPTTWSLGVKTNPGFGGIPLHTHFPLTHSTLTISSQTTTNRFTLRRATNNSITRLVLKGTYPTSYPAAAPTAGVPTGGASETVTLSNGHVYTVTFVAGRWDVAPWSVTSTNDVGGANTAIAADVYNTEAGCELKYTVRYMQKTRGDVIKLMDGIYNAAGQTINLYWGMNFGSFGTATFAAGTAGEPTAPFSDGTYVYGPAKSLHSGIITVKGDSPLGAVFSGLVGLDMKYQSVATNFGIAFANCLFNELTSMQVGRMVGYHHCKFTKNAGPVLLGNSTSYVSKQFFIRNYVIGSGAYYGADTIVCANRLTSQRPAQDLNKLILSDSDQANPISEFAWNLIIDKEGLDDSTHEDLVQCDATSLYHGLAGDNRWARIYGNIIWRGDGALNGSGQQLTGGQCYYFGNVLTDRRTNFEFLGNIVVEQATHGLSVTNGGFLIANWNTMLYDPAVQNPASTGNGQPGFWFRAPQGGTTVGSDITVNHNICTKTIVEYDFGVQPNGSASNNTLGLSRDQVLAMFAQADMGAGAEDVADVIDALTFKAGQAISRGATSNKAIIDHERQTKDWALLTA